MGCDIHFYVEKRRGDAWTFVEEPDEPGRNYELFSVLAGVQPQPGYPVAVPRRGLPDDVSEGVQTEWDFWEADGHSPSWLLLSEALAIPWERFPETWVFERFVALLRSLAESEDPTAVRLVFWFDN